MVGNNKRFSGFYEQVLRRFFVVIVRYFTTVMPYFFLVKKDLKETKDDGISRSPETVFRLSRG